MTEDEIHIWKSTIKQVISENKPPEKKHKSERYNVIFEEFKLPPKEALRRSLDFIEDKHPNINTVKERNTRGGVPTNQFFEDFGFKITEDLLYNNADSKKLKNHVEKKIQNSTLFQAFINFGHTFLSDLDIEVYKVRMALEAQGVLSIIVGMRAAYSYEEKGGVALIGFLASKSFKEINQNKYSFVYDYSYKGKPDQDFIKIEVRQWSEIDSAILQEHKEQFKLQYDKIKNSKRTQWNVEAKTTSNALKCILFENQNIKEFMSGIKFESSSVDLIKILRERFKRIWRCADSNKWDILKDHDLLTFDWLDNNIDYSSIDIKSLPRGKKAIDPWVNRMKKGDLVFVMGKTNITVSQL